MLSYSKLPDAERSNCSKTCSRGCELHLFLSVLYAPRRRLCRQFAKVRVFPSPLVVRVVLQQWNERTSNERAIQLTERLIESLKERINQSRKVTEEPRAAMQADQESSSGSASPAEQALKSLPRRRRRRRRRGFLVLLRLFVCLSLSLTYNIYIYIELYFAKQREFETKRKRKKERQSDRGKMRDLPADSKFSCTEACRGGKGWRRLDEAPPLYLAGSRPALFFAWPADGSLGRSQSQVCLFAVCLFCHVPHTNTTLPLSRALLPPPPPMHTVSYAPQCRPLSTEPSTAMF